MSIDRIALQVKLTLTALLFLALPLVFSASAFAAPPSGAYETYLVQDRTSYADTLIFTASPGNPNEGTVASTQLGFGEFHYSTAENMLLVYFNNSLGTPPFVMAGTLVGTQWQGVLSILNSDGAAWVAQQTPFTPDPLDFGPAVEVAKDLAHPNGRDYAGFEWPPAATPLSFTLTNSFSSTGVVQSFGGLSGHFATSTYTSSNQQLLVMGLPGNRVYGAVVELLGSTVQLKGAWFHPTLNEAGQFLVDSQ